MSRVTPNTVRAIRRIQEGLASVEAHRSKNWLEFTYRQHLVGGWTRDDGSPAPPHVKAIAFHEAGKALFCPGMPGAGGCGTQVGYAGSDPDETFDCPKCEAAGLKIPPKRTGPGNFLVAAPTYSKHFPLTNNPYIEKRLGHRIVNQVKNQQGVVTMHELDDGSQIHCLSYEQELKKGKNSTSPFEGSALDAAWLDEPPPRSAWIAIKRGLMNSASRYSSFPWCQTYKFRFAAGGNRSGKSHTGASEFSALVEGRRPWDDSLAPHYGAVVMTATPLECPWLFHEIYKRAWNKGGDARHIFAMEFEIYDNPSLTKEAIDGIFRDGMNQDEVAARIYGRFRFLTGRIFNEFAEDLHVYSNVRFDPLRLDYRPENDEPSNVPLIHTVDPHFKKPWMMAWHAVMPDGSMICVREWPTEPYEKLKTCSMGYDDYAAQIAEIEAEFPGGRERVLWRDMDPNLSRTPQQQASGSSTIQKEMASRGYYFRSDVNDKLSHGHQEVHTLLSYDEDRPLDELNRPRYLVEEGCRNVIYGFENYCWQEHDDVEKAPKDKPKDLGKDAMDVVRYAVVRKPAFIDWRNRSSWYDDQLSRRMNRTRAN